MKLSKIIMFLTLLSCGCTKFVKVAPPNNEIVGVTVYSNDATATSAVSGIYETMISNSVGGGNTGISELTGLSADEIALYPNNNILLNEVYVDGQESNNPPTIWQDLYSCLYQANYAIQALGLSSGITPAKQAQLIGESKFVRAFCLFYLTELYGDVPLVTSPEYQVNDGLARASRSQVYGQIIGDLLDAQNLLSDTYATANSGRIVPNKSAATALLARTYLYSKKWDSAALEASAVINDGQYTLDTLGGVFLAQSPEAIWQLEPLDNGFATPDGIIFVPPFIFSTGPSVNYVLYLSNSLVNAFEPNDLRRTKWIDSVVVSGTIYYYPHKYQQLQANYPPPENVVLLRLGEQYLIRAEAETYGVSGGIPAAILDLDTIRYRAGLPDYSGPTDQNSLINAILHERRVELFTEYGHRWLDLQRTGEVDSVMPGACSQKGGTWSPNWELYPVPLTEIQADSRLSQNAGY